MNAAIACDFDELARLARQTQGFNFTFGPDEMGPGVFWRSQEEKGERILAMLVLILQMPAGGKPGEAFTWPSVFDAPEERSHTASEWKALSKLYSAEQIQVFKDEGDMGWRTAIGADGRWLYFISGD